VRNVGLIASIKILFRKQSEDFMYRGLHSPSGLLLIVAALAFLFLILCGAAGADMGVNNTTGLVANNSTPTPTLLKATVTQIIHQVSQDAGSNVSSQETLKVSLSPSPRLVLNRTDTGNLAVTVYGAALPGSVNTSITSIRWDWGDNGTVEYHEFPYSHTYSIPGTYTFSVTAFQSDGQTTTHTETVIFAALPVIPGPVEIINTSVPGGVAGPGPVTGPPVLTLLEPVVDGLNVTLNGNLNPGYPAATIKSVIVNWDDGNLAEYKDLPAMHQYSSTGIYTVNITGNQSDGQLITKSLTVDVKPGNQVPPGPSGMSPPPGNEYDPLIIPLLIILIVVIGIVALLIVRRRSHHPVIHDTSPAQGKNKITGPVIEPKNGILNNPPSAEEQVRICTGTDITPEVLDAVIRVAIEIAREGREGQSVGTSFVVGDTERVLTNSKQFVLNPFFGHKEDERRITDARLHENIKEFAQLDGAFIISDSGIVEAAGRYITLDMSQVELPGGLGSRHSSIAGITQATRSIGIVVSQSGGRITIFRGGKIVYTMHT
jgi:DNA integrity scanning protein DisA with diadenylate cyclase activity